MDSWFLLASAVAVLWGTSGIFAKYSTPRLGVYRVALVIALVEGVMYTSAFLLLRDDRHIALWDGVLATASCVIGVCGFLCYFESIMDGQVSIVGAISAAYPALTVIGALILLSETLTMFQALGVAAIIAGVMGLSYNPNPGSKTAVSKRALTFAVLAFFLWGFWGLTSKAAVDVVGAGNLFGFYVISSLTAPVLYAWFRKIRPGALKGTDPSAKAWAMGGMVLLLNVVGAFIYTFALEMSSASLVGPVSSAYPIVTAVLAIGLFKERVSWLQGALLVVVTAGLVLMGL